MNELLNPMPEAVIYEDVQLYVCLASYPVTHGHTIVVWKEKVEDLHLLQKGEYEYLMDRVDIVRNVLLDYFHVEKVYLMYLDEVKQVHWHLIPRYNEQGYNVFKHDPVENKDFSDAPALRILLNSGK